MGFILNKFPKVFLARSLAERLSYASTVPAHALSRFSFHGSSIAVATGDSELWKIETM